MTDDRDRQDRNRIFELQRALDDRQYGPGGLTLQGSPSLLGKVVDGGSLPTSVGHYVLVNPGRHGGPPVEGGPVTKIWDTTRKVAVYVAAGQPYQVGDELVARLVGRGRWAAEGKGKPCGFVFTIRGCNNGLVTGAAITLSQGGDAVATCTTTGRITAVTRTAIGINYTGVPTVSFSGGLGSGAAATAIMRVASIARTSGGTGYADGSYTNGTFSGDGTGGTFSYSVVGGVVQAALTITNPGKGYTSPPTPVFNAGPGTGAAATTTLGLDSFVITDGGTGYVSGVTVAVTGDGSGATASAGVTPSCRFVVPAGTYDYNVTPPEGYLPISSTGLVLSCPGNGADVGIRSDLTIAPGYFCSACCNSPLPLVWYIEDDYGVHALTHGVGSPGLPTGDSWGLDYTAVGLASVDASCVSAPDTPIRYVLLLDCPSGVTNNWALYITYWFPTCSPASSSFSNNKLPIAIVNLTGPKLPPDCNPTSLTFDIPTVISPITMVPTPGGGGTIVATR